MNFSIGMLVVSMGEYLYMRVYAYILVLGMSVSTFVLEFLNDYVLLEADQDLFLGSSLR